jgi:Protein of unknown function (DUF4435)
MIGQIDGYYVAAQIRMVRQVHKGTILILEGETDARVFARFIDCRSCDIEVGFGKKNVIEALDLLEEGGVPGVVAVIDADFDRLLGTTYRPENLCITDAHDLDLTIFLSAALDRYIAEYADVDLFKNKFKSDLWAVRDRVVNASLPLAYCRFTSEHRNLGLYFKDLKHHEFVNLDDLSIDSSTLVAELISRSSTRCTVSNLKIYIANEAARKHDPFQLANGHDVAAILGIALRKLLANRKTVQTWASEVEAGLRLAFDWEALAGTALYQGLRDWEANNKPYRIFRQ